MKLHELSVGDKVIIDNFDAPEYVGIYSDNYGIRIGDQFIIHCVNGDKNMKCITTSSGVMVIAGAAIFKKIENVEI